MMTNPIKRRTIINLGSMAAVAGSVAAARAAARPTAAQLQTMVPSVSKAAVGYRDIPWHGRVCGACVWFKPPDAGTTVSHCHLVAGPISAAGWCQAWMKP
ncbi:High potential iron-sulfur protein [Acidiphilium rubrum]|uniref:High-potential iron-sulfur protein n=3 Tax=Acidocellaceae TaxID=3385905 RepID=A0A8G2CLV1_ACIRU|nr:High potential iron-sulfur protein [Acidiphilium rubrum]